MDAKLLLQALQTAFQVFGTSHVLYITLSFPRASTASGASRELFNCYSTAKNE